MFLILSLSEFINIYVLGLMNIDFNTESINIFKKLLLGIPSLIIMVVFIFIIKLLLKKKARKEYVNY
ncbi:putative membrane protein (fragment) [Clostridium neonatale]